MRILMVLESVFPQDERVEKEIASLLEAGHEVRIATYTFEDSDLEETYNGYTIYRKKLSPIMYKLGAAILVLPFYFRFWRSYLCTIYASWTFDAIHIHDLPLARLGYEMQRKKGVIFVADQHEFYSSWIVKTAHYNTLMGKVIRFLSTWVSYERKYLQAADLVCTVEVPLRELYIRDRGVDPDKVVVIPNTPLRSIYSVEPVKPSGDHFKLYYHGGLDILRGLDIAIRAMPLLREEIPGIRLVLVGKRNKHFDPVQRAAELGVDDLLEMRGWTDYRELPGEIDRANVCFFTPPTNREEIHNTIATKIYQYMARGKPVIVGRARYMKEFVEKYQVGEVIDEEQTISFVEAVKKLHSDAGLMEKYSKNALLNIEKFYWETTVGKLLQFYASSAS